MTVAVVTMAAGRAAHLDRLLAGLARGDRRPDDVVVVDLRPADPTVRDVVASRARCIAGPTTAGGALALAAGRNAGAAATDCERLVFLDVDCIPAPDLVGAYEAALADHPGALACGPVRYLREGWAEDLAGTPLDVASLHERSDAPAARPVPPQRRVGDDHDLFWSLSFGVTAGTWAAIGGFDEAYVGYGAEDTDFAWRARAAGVPLVWLADGVAFHQWHPPSRFDPHRLDEMLANARRFRHRWGRWPMAGWFDELDRAGLVRFDPEAGVLERVP